MHLLVVKFLKFTKNSNNDLYHNAKNREMVSLAWGNYHHLTLLSALLEDSGIDLDVDGSHESHRGSCIRVSVKIRCKQCVVSCYMYDHNILRHAPVTCLLHPQLTTNIRVHQNRFIEINYS